MSSHGARSLQVPANGLSHHVLEWDALPAATATVLLLHGFMDAAASWESVAPALAAHGFRVLAPDLRGFGDAPRVPDGAYYHFADYVFDVADIVAALVPSGVPGAPLFVVGHSMGGSVATLFAGTFPERVSRLAILEGSGPPDSAHDEAPARMRRWIDQVRAARGRARPRTMADRDEALRRLAGNHPHVAEDVRVRRLDALARALPDGRLAWKADPLHATRAPVPFFAQSWMAFARSVGCPVLSVSGGPTGWRAPDDEARVAAFASVTRAELPDAGHMMHWTRPANLTRLLLDFFGSNEGRGVNSP